MRGHLNAARHVPGLVRWQRPVLEALAEAANRSGEVVMPMDRIAAHAGRCGEATAARAIRDLEALGLVQVVKRYKPAREDGFQPRACNGYRVFPGGLPEGLDL